MERAQEGLVPLLRDQTEHVLKDCGVGSETTRQNWGLVDGARTWLSKKTKKTNRRRGGGVHRNVVTVSAAAVKGLIKEEDRVTCVHAYMHR